MEKKVIAFLGDFYHQRAPLEQTVKAAMGRIEGIHLEITSPTTEQVSAALDENPAMMIMGAENR